MSYSCTVVCDRDRCGFSALAEFVPGAGKLRTPEGWRYLGRGVHVCPACAEGLAAWLHRQPQPPARFALALDDIPPHHGDIVSLATRIPAGSDHLLDVDADGRITADDDVPTPMPARQVTS